MNAHIRRTFYLLTLGFVALVGVLAYWQVYAKQSLASDPSNRLQSRKLQEVPRGLILAGDGQTKLAQSEKQGDGTYQRAYPEGPLYANIVGYWSSKYGASGIEISQNNNLSGTGEPETLEQLINQAKGGPNAGNDVELTVDPELQRIAYDGLAQSSSGRGSAVAIDPKSGQILAMASYPSYDPNNIDQRFEEIQKDPNQPLVNRATQGLYPPGSTFKVITTAAALKAGVKPSDKFNDTGTYETPGYTVYNYKGEKYGNVTFSEAFGYSINAIFAKVAYEYVGAPSLAQTAQDFGFGDAYKDFSLPVAPSSLGELPPNQWAQGLTAQVAFGQGPTVSNTFEMALVAATVANDGTMMEPRVVKEVRSPDGLIIDQPSSKVHRQALDKSTARTINTMMQEVVDNVETSGKISGIKVAGKTGTAEAPSKELHSWFIAFAPADDPKIAVAVLVENGQEGYKQALPIARRMMEAYLKTSPSSSTSESTTTTSQPAAGSQNAAPQNPSQPPPQSPSSGQRISG